MVFIISMWEDLDEQFIYKETYIVSRMATRAEELRAEIERLKELEAGLEEKEARLQKAKKAKKPGKAKKGKEPKKAPKAPKTPEARPPAPEKSAIEVARETEEFDRRKLAGLMSGYVEKLLPDYKEIARKGATKTFCMPPSVKESLAKKLRNDIKNKIDAIDRDRELGKPVSDAEAALVTKLYALAEALKRTPTCEIKELDKMFEMVQKEYPEKEGITYEEMIGKIAEEKTAAKMKRSAKGRKALARKIEKEKEHLIELSGLDPDTITSDQMAVIEAEAAAKATEAMADRSVDEFLRSQHGGISRRLQGYLYDGAKGQEEVMPSPCGLKIPMEGKAAISKAEDILTFFGSKDDWKDFYIEGDERAEAGTFHRMHVKDWPGCMKDIFFDNKTVTEEELKKILDEVNKTLKGKKKLKISDFVTDEILQKGYGY